LAPSQGLVQVSSFRAPRGVPADPVRALQHALYRAANAGPGRRFNELPDKVIRSDILWRAWVTVRSNNGAPGIDKTTLAGIGEYGQPGFSMNAGTFPCPVVCSNKSVVPYMGKL
jgi:RNA-directed DNA polymerase